jgi:hypothetical protein
MLQTVRFTLPFRTIKPLEPDLPGQKVGAREYFQIFCPDPKFCTARAVAIFDGIEIESGVAFEIGFAYCLGKPIVGIKIAYRTFSEMEEINLILEVPISRICHSVLEALSMPEKLTC